MSWYGGVSPAAAGQAAGTSRGAGAEGPARKRRARLALLTRGLPRRGSVPRWLLAQFGLASLLGLLGGFFVALVLATSQLGVSIVQLWLLITALLLLKWLLHAVDEPPRLPPASSDPLAAEPPAAGFPHRDRWERRLSISDRDPDWYRRVVRDRVTAVVRERLRQRHGIRLREQPDLARQLLGEPLYEFMTGPLTRTPSPAQLDRLLTRIEEI